MPYKIGDIVHSGLGYTCGRCGTERQNLEYFGTGDWRCVGSCQASRDTVTLMEVLDSTYANIVIAHVPGNGQGNGGAKERSIKKVEEAPPRTTSPTSNGSNDSSLYERIRDVLDRFIEDIGTT